MLLDNVTTGRQTQTGSLDFVLCGVKRLKDLIQIIGRNPYSGVSDRHNNPIFFQPGAYDDLSARLDKGLRRIIQQIEQYLFDLVLHRGDHGEEQALPAAGPRPQLLRLRNYDYPAEIPHLDRVCRCQARGHLRPAGQGRRVVGRFQPVDSNERLRGSATARAVFPPQPPAA